MIYLDDSATTQIDSKVLEKMMPYLTLQYGNPSSTHSFGQQSKFAIDEARYIIAKYLECTPQEIIFTSTGSESIALGLKGTAEYFATKSNTFKPESVYFVTSPLEHSTVMKTITHLNFWGYKNRVVKVDKDGKVVLDSLRDVLEAIKKEDAKANIIVTIQYVNSEIGTIQNISDISRIAHEYNAIVHTDAMQAAKFLNLSIKELNVDMLTFAAHKIYGPVGAAALYLKSGSKISRQIDGGEQEYKIRAGTENTSAIVGFGKAVELLLEEKDDRKNHIIKLSELFINNLQKKISNIVILAQNTKIPSINAIVFTGIDAKEFVVRLDLAGIMASVGSACNSGSIQPTTNLKYIGLNEKDIDSVIRFSIGKNNTEDEISRACDIIAQEYYNYIQNKKIQKTSFAKKN